MTLVNTNDGSPVMVHEQARYLLTLMSAELSHWSACSSCLKGTTDHSIRHRAARLA